MINRATLTITGLYNWDDKLFNNLTLPVGIDKNEVVEDILYQCADLEVVYPDWDVMAKAIGVWSNEALFRWNKINNLSKLSYNPIENYDMMETETISDSKNKTGTEAQTGTVNQSQTENSAGTNNSVTGNNNTVENLVTGFNTTSPVTNTKDITTGANTETGNSSVNTTTNNNSAVDNISNKNENEVSNILRNNRRHGNLGVMTPADMIRKELEIYPELNLYEIIPVEFKMRFCIMVY